MRLVTDEAVARLREERRKRRSGRRFTVPEILEFFAAHKAYWMRADHGRRATPCRCCAATVQAGAGRPVRIQWGGTWDFRRVLLCVGCADQVQKSPVGHAEQA